MTASFVPLAQCLIRTYSEHMVANTFAQKLAILSDAAKYDASCASSGTRNRHSRDGKGLGSTEGSGICHAYAPDGRCISLLKILMTNFCIYDCAYCVNRISSNVPRARFAETEVVSLTLEFYRRNFIEGLFLSSGIIRSSDETMAAIVRIAKSLRLEHHFRGYIHLKTIPDASPALIDEAGLYADRLSINIEMPTDSGLVRFAPEKNPVSIRTAMACIKLKLGEQKDRTHTGRKPQRFAPAGQSTQMIVGADQSTDADVLERSASLYSSYGLRRVYYSAFSPIPDASRVLPLMRPPLMREHRLYQADWLTRFYGFRIQEITDVAKDGMLDLGIDPKLAWALAHRGQFPMDVNRASREQLLRVPGFGTKTVKRILASRMHRRLRYEDLLRIGAIMSKARPFVVAEGWSPGSLLDADKLRQIAAPKAEQLSLL
jgi:putative DNA modification/repair radical SAM protein